MTPTIVFSGVPVTTVQIEVGEEGAVIPSTVYQFGRNKATSCLVSVEDGPVRFSFGADATQDFGHLLYAGESLVLSNPAAIGMVRFFNASQVAATLTVTAER